MYSAIVHNAVTCCSLSQKYASCLDW